MKRYIIAILVISLVGATVGCELTRSQKGAAIGSSTGAVIGAAIGNRSCLLYTSDAADDSVLV